MSCVIDHLTSDARVRVLQDFTDAHGLKVHAGETGVIRLMELDWPNKEIGIEWERGGVMEKMSFGLWAKDGPRNGHMREYFEVEGAEPRPRTVPQRRRSTPAPVPAASVDSKSIGYGDGLARVHALAAARQFSEADALVRALLDGPDRHGCILEQMAEDLGSIAVAYADDDPVYAWGREWATNLWYSWGAGATSGGEGAARARVIDRAMESFNRRSGQDC